jgi:hypothetical protein
MEAITLGTMIDAEEFDSQYAALFGADSTGHRNKLGKPL